MTRRSARARPYYYEVQATNAAGNSAFSNVFQAATVMPPAPPTNLPATNITTTEVDLSWTNVATNATGIKILKQLGSNSSQVIASGLAPTTTSYDITGLTAGHSLPLRGRCSELERPFGRGNDRRGHAARPGHGRDRHRRRRARSPSAGAADQSAVNYNVYRSTSPGGEGTDAHVDRPSPARRLSTGRPFPAPPTTTRSPAVDPNSCQPDRPDRRKVRPPSEVSAAAQSGTSQHFNAPSNLVGYAARRTASATDLEHQFHDRRPASPSSERPTPPSPRT